MKKGASHCAMRIDTSAGMAAACARPQRQRRHAAGGVQSGTRAAADGSPVVMAAARAEAMAPTVRCW